jgi:nucleoside 2-deoxyribosyltransferase
MKIYIAGKIREQSEREQLEKIDSLCKSLGHETFLPHRDAGLCKSIEDVKEIFNKDITEGMKSIDLVIASLDGLHIGAGTAWELGYAYANKIPTVGLKTDELPEDALEELSAILLASMPIMTSFEELKNHLTNLTK